MGLYIGATGLNEIDDLIEDATNILMNRIIIEDYMVVITRIK